MNYQKIKVSADAGLSTQEIDAYIDYIREKNPGREIEALDIHVDGDYVDLVFNLRPIKFERIRRITGYLVGNTDRWNDAKRAEERDRVKHRVDPYGFYRRDEV